MAEDKKLENTEEQTEGSEESEGATKKKKSNLLLIVSIFGIVLILSLLSYFFLLKDDSAKNEEVVEEVQQSVFFEMPEIIVSLSGNTSNIRYLKLVLSLEIASAEDQVVVENMLPKITDSFQVYLRQLRLEDLRGSIGTNRIKDSLLLRINQIVQPAQVKEVLLKEMLVQ